MKLSHSLPAGKTETLIELALDLQSFVDLAVASGDSLYETEKRVLVKVLQMGRLAVDRFLQAQGAGDLGPVVQTADGVELRRSEGPRKRSLRTVFGQHTLNAYVYSPGPKQKIALRPIDARLNLPAGKYSYLLEEFSQVFLRGTGVGPGGRRISDGAGPATVG